MSPLCEMRLSSVDLDADPHGQIHAECALIPVFGNGLQPSVVLKFGAIGAGFSVRLFQQDIDSLLDLLGLARNALRENVIREEASDEPL